MNGAGLSGVLAKIYGQICEFLGETYHEVKAEVENSYHQYDKSYRERHGQIKVFCVGMREPIPLDGVYVAVQFLNQHTVSRYNSPKDVEQAFRERDSSPFDSVSDEPQDGMQVANSKQYLMLLGGPGVGKSTFLRKVGLKALEGKNENFEHECIPVFLELKRFTKDQIDIETLITKEFEICGFPHPDHLTNAALKAGNLLILFDGLDEVPAANVGNVIRKIGDFVDQYNQNRFIASCRIAAYKGGFTRFTEVEMANFDDSQIEAYIENWFKSTPDPNFHRLDKQMETAEQCWTMLNASEHSATKELARNPLLLTLLCIFYDTKRKFPRNRTELYDRVLNIFLEEWSTEKRVCRDLPGQKYVDASIIERILFEIAVQNLEGNRLLFKKRNLTDQIQAYGKRSDNTSLASNARKVLDTILIDPGLFVQRFADFYSFPHLTFQEYLAANYFVSKKSTRKLVTKHLHDEQWREVFLFAAELMLTEADRLLVEMEAEAAKSINTPRLKALFRWAERITDSKEDCDNSIAKRLFAIRQYFSLWLLNQIHEGIKKGVNRNLDRELDLYRELGLYLDLYQDPYRKIDTDLYHALDLDLYNNLCRDLNLDLNLDLDLALVFALYQDLYQYMAPNFHSLVSSEFGDKFDKELEARIAVIKHMERAKIFTRANLKRMVRRLNSQREFIKVIRKSESVKPPHESIHDTWLSVLDITDEMLAISREEFENYIQYFRALVPIIDCKEAAGHISPDVWKGIEDRFFTMDAEEDEA